MRLPPSATYRRLLILGNGAIVLNPMKRDWLPLLRRGWVVDAGWAKPGDGSLPSLRITPAGLRALADWIEREGMPPIEKAARP